MYTIVFCDTEYEIRNSKKYFIACKLIQTNVFEYLDNAPLNVQ